MKTFKELKDKIKVGDKLHFWDNGCEYWGTVSTIYRINGYTEIKFSDNTHQMQLPEDDNDKVEILNRKSKIMNLKESFLIGLMKEPEKSFRKAGITNGDNMLTDEGREVFLSWLLHSQFAADFKKDVVEDMLKEQEKDCK